MDAQYYVFALFLASLVCAIIVLCKVLFSGVKRQHKVLQTLLDEKETKLLTLYLDVEEIMDEFNRQAEATIADIKEHKRQAAGYLPQPKPMQMSEKAASAHMRTEEKSEAQREKFQSDALEVIASRRAELESESLNMRCSKPEAKADGGSLFKRIIDIAVDEPITLPPVSAAVSPKNKRSEAILELKKQGKSETQIAQELGITQNEVKIVIGLTAGG